LLSEFPNPVRKLWINLPHTVTTTVLCLADVAFQVKDLLDRVRAAWFECVCLRQEEQEEKERSRGRLRSTGDREIEPRRGRLRSTFQLEMYTDKY
jgi:hypothetical protein